jgi:hypothetical protein
MGAIALGTLPTPDEPPQNPKITAKQFDESFDALAEFLFDQYRQYKASKL